MWGFLHFLIVPNDAVSRKRKREKEGEKRKRLIPKRTGALNRADVDGAKGNLETAGFEKW